MLWHYGYHFDMPVFAVVEQISLNMSDFELENNRYCMYDYVIIYNTTRTPVPYCGSIKFSSGFVSTANSMMIRFHSDRSNVNRGFSATYRFVK
eukprot:XP_012810946.1 PREDICTED: embryonic protein UVS.2-like [Xenopus tropicalis]